MDSDDPSVTYGRWRYILSATASAAVSPYALSHNHQLAHAISMSLNGRRVHDDPGLGRRSAITLSQRRRQENQRSSVCNHPSHPIEAGVPGREHQASASYQRE